MLISYILIVMIFFGMNYLEIMYLKLSYIRIQELSFYISYCYTKLMAAFIKNCQMLRILKIYRLFIVSVPVMCVCK